MYTTEPRVRDTEIPVSVPRCKVSAWKNCTTRVPGPGCTGTLVVVVPGTRVPVPGYRVPGYPGKIFESCARLRVKKTFVVAAVFGAGLQ
eukprot:1103678-Rhodomonas_salina.1